MAFTGKATYSAGSTLPELAEDRALDYVDGFPLDQPVARLVILQKSNQFQRRTSSLSFV